MPPERLGGVGDERLGALDRADVAGQAVHGAAAERLELGRRPRPGGRDPGRRWRRRTPSAASARAAPRPNPPEAAATAARRPAIPRSMAAT